MLNGMSFMKDVGYTNMEGIKALLTLGSLPYTNRDRFQWNGEIDIDS